MTKVPTRDRTVNPYGKLSHWSISLVAYVMRGDKTTLTDVKISFFAMSPRCIFRYIRAKVPFFA